MRLDLGIGSSLVWVVFGGDGDGDEVVVVVLSLTEMGNIIQVNFYEYPTNTTQQIPQPPPTPPTD